MAISKSLLLVALTLSVAVIARADEDYYARYRAAAPGDDPNTRGKLELEVDDDDSNTVEYEIELYNAIDVTGVHLHLEGNSSDGLFGGPLFLALTNTSASPVSSSGDRALRQSGRNTSEQLARNPQTAQVQARLQALNINLGQLGIDASTPFDISDLKKLIEAGLIYTDVHTVQRVSPQGLTRGRVYTEDPEDNDDDDAATAIARADASATAARGGTASASAGAAASASTNGDDDGSSSQDEGGSSQDD